MSYQDPITVSGSLVTFNDPDGDGRITNLSAAISTVQDLNGYDHPWPAGGGKNKFNIDAVDGTPDPTTGSNATSPRILEFGKFYKGLRSDNYYYPSYASYTISGGVLSVTASDNNAYGAAYTVEVDGGEDVTVSGVSPDGFVSVGWYDSDWNYLSGSIAYAIPHTFTMQTNAKCAVFVFRAPANSTATFSNIQIEKGSAATLWTPYENICPITGWDGVKVQRTGKNLSRPSLVSVLGNNVLPNKASVVLDNNEYVFTPTGTNEDVFIGSLGFSAGSICNLVGNVPVKEGLTYSATVSDDASLFGGNNNFVQFMDASGKCVLNQNNPYLRFGRNAAFTVPQGVKYVGFRIGSQSLSAGNTYRVKLQLELGSTATAYEPYQGNTYTIQLGQTVYGGTLDVTAGTLTVDRAYVGLSGRTWTMATETGGNVFSCNAITGENGKALNYNFVCNMYKAVAKYRSQLVSGEIGTFNGTNGRNRFSICDNNYSTVESFVASISDLYVCYELATPLTYQLTQREVDALLGTNNIWADAGDVTVTYQLARHGFEGWLIKVGTEQTEIPINFIRYSTYKVTPDQRMEWSAERNVNGVLQRETVPNMPPKIEFNTKLLTNSDVTALMSILNKSFTVASERKLPVYFYDPENNTYKTCDCYMPDIDFKIRNVDTVKNIINYEELRFAFIGY